MLRRDVGRSETIVHTAERVDAPFYRSKVCKLRSSR